MADSEREFARWLQAAAPLPESAGVGFGIGDDMAAIHRPGDLLLVSSDLMLEGVHFDLAEHSLTAVGRKAAGCALSDCAAMAVEPLAATVSLAWPRDRDFAGARALMGGLIDALARFDCALVGGDTTGWPHGLAVDVNVLARPYPGIEPVRRDGARAGDGIFVTGPLGGSIAGKHLDFVPRIAEARALATALGPRLHALIDITDGLAIDCDRVIEASGVGAVLDAEAVMAVASQAARALANDDTALREQVLRDGEDFELLVFSACEPAEAEALGLFGVGDVVASPGLRLRDADGNETPLSAQGYEHF
jgi:thiamine-monophosphate kinase